MRKARFDIFRKLFSPASSVAKYNVLLHNPPVLKFLFAGVISFLGDNITYFALLKKGYDLSGGNIMDLGFITIARALPVMFLGLLGGVIADRRSRRNIMIIFDLLNGVAILALVFIRNIEAILLIVFITSCFHAFRSPAQNALEPNLVAPSEIPLLNSFRSFLYGIVGIASFTLGAAVITFSGITACFILDAATFIFSAIIIATTRINESHLEGAENHVAITPGKTINTMANQFKNDLKAGFAAMRGNLSLKFLLVLEMAIFFLFGSQAILLYAFIRERVLLGAKSELALGVFMSSYGLGAIAGSIMIGLMMKRYPNRFKLLLGSLLLDGMVRAGFSLNTFLPFSLLLAVALGIIFTGLQIMLSTILQEIVTNENRGRISSFFNVLDNPVAIISVFLGMATAKLITAQGTLLVLSVLEVAIAIAALSSKTYRMINQQTDKAALLLKPEDTITA